MAVHNSEIASTVREYLTHWPDETEDLAPFTDALQDDVSLCGRHAFQAGGHVTCGAAVLNTFGEVLFILNRPLDKWLLPGGHLEPTDASLHAAAVRELVEETGIPQSAIDAELNQRRPLDIGLYHIPANSRKEEPAHWHADFCFGFLVDRPELHLQVSEIGGFAWKKSFDDLIPGLTQKLKAIDR
ncbi:NUDIX hydrolase [Streptomyces sp. NBC_01244]|uniref:NUDIX hydrolase n=1 Tax=Streptomyces sp. NBC_01244 TaxID=2903797 RepID=UPI002E10634A|nr:NUDIX domain-containing protein [Streptomyces sp. NBC_01244]